MVDERKTPPDEGEKGFGDQIAAKAMRKRRAQRSGHTGIWYGLGMSGLIGWSVAVPTIVGALLGLWLDHHYPGDLSWTLTLLLAGLVLGCVNAWHWVTREQRALREESEGRDE